MMSDDVEPIMRLDYKRSKQGSLSGRSGKQSLRTGSTRFTDLQASGRWGLGPRVVSDDFSERTSNAYSRMSAEPSQGKGAGPSHSGLENMLLEDKAERMLYSNSPPESVREAFVSSKRHEDDDAQSQLSAIVNSLLKDDEGEADAGRFSVRGEGQDARADEDELLEQCSDASDNSFLPHSDSDDSDDDEDFGPAGRTVTGRTVSFDSLARFGFNGKQLRQPKPPQLHQQPETKFRRGHDRSKVVKVEAWPSPPESECEFLPIEPEDEPAQLIQVMPVDDRRPALGNPSHSGQEAEQPEQHNGEAGCNNMDIQDDIDQEGVAIAGSAGRALLRSKIRRSV